MNIKLNGKNIDTDKKTAYEIKKKYFDKTCIAILNGYQLDTDYELSENDELFIIKKGVLPNKDALQSMLYARHTPHIQNKIKSASVAVAGLGGLGSNVAVSLARIGVGRLKLVDFDVVEPSNLNRQSYFISDIGKYKTDALCEQLKRINPYISIETECCKVTHENIEELFFGYDIVCEAFDKAESKALLINGVMESFPNTLIVSGSGMAGYYSSNKILTKRRMKNLYICGDEENEAKIGQGLMAPRVQVCAGHEANMVLRLILGISEP